MNHGVEEDESCCVIIFLAKCVWWCDRHVVWYSRMWYHVAFMVNGTPIWDSSVCCDRPFFRPSTHGRGPIRFTCHVEPVKPCFSWYQTYLSVSLGIFDLISIRSIALLNPGRHSKTGGRRLRKEHSIGNDDSCNETARVGNDYPHNFISFYTDRCIYKFTPNTAAYSSQK